MRFFVANPVSRNNRVLHDWYDMSRKWLVEPHSGRVAIRYHSGHFSSCRDDLRNAQNRVHDVTGCPKPSKRKISDFRSESVTEWIPAGFREPCRGKIGTSIQFQRILSEVRVEYYDPWARFSPILKIRNRVRSGWCTKSLHRRIGPHVACGYVVRIKMIIYSISASQERGSGGWWTCLTQISTDLHNSQRSWSKLVHKIVTLKWHFWSSKSVRCVW